MKKTRAFALFISFILVLGVVLAAEYTGTLGPDQNTGVGLEAEAQLQSTSYLANGASCSADSECSSGHCAEDYDGSGSWCATANYCAHNGTVSYANGSTTCYGNYKETCTNGTWVAELCSASCQNGQCTGGTVCGNGQCETGETCSSCPSDCGTCPTEEAVSGGVGGGGPRPTPTPTVTPTPSPTPVEEYTRETILEQTSKYTPSKEEIGENLVEAGITEPEQIEKILEQTSKLSIEKTLKVEKKTNIRTGEESFESNVSISVTNTSESIFTECTAIELIPKELVSDSGMISSEQPFTIEETNDYWIVKWSCGELMPEKTTTFTYSVDFELSDEILKKSKSLFSAEKKELPPEIYGKIVVNVLFNGVSQEGIVVSLYKDDVKIAEKTTDATGRAEFASLSAGTYYVISQATDKFNSVKSTIIELKAGETKTIELLLSEKPITPMPTPVPGKIPWQWIGLVIMLFLVVVIGYFFREQLLEWFAGRKPKGLARAIKKVEKMEKEKAKRPFKKFREKREKREEPEEKPKKTERKVYKCDVCGEEFHTEIALNAHKKRYKH